MIRTGSSGGNDTFTKRLVQPPDSGTGFRQDSGARFGRPGDGCLEGEHGQPTIQGIENRVDHRLLPIVFAGAGSEEGFVTPALDQVHGRAVIPSPFGGDGISLVRPWEELFADDFESGDTSAWSAALP